MFWKAVPIICSAYTILSQSSVGEHDQKMIQLLTEKVLCSQMWSNFDFLKYIESSIEL